MSSVELGFLEKCARWELESRLFPSKAGGKPAWLDLEGVPGFDDLACPLCRSPTIFLCQLYAPYEDSAANFHRTVYVFVCRTAACCRRNDGANVLVVRSALPRANKFYEYKPPKEEPEAGFAIDRWLRLCNACGCRGEKTCGGCQTVSYCCREHQVRDWKCGQHKLRCGRDSEAEYADGCGLLFDEWIVCMESEPAKQEQISEEKALEAFARLQHEEGAGSMSDALESDLLAHFDEADGDKAFLRFRKRVSAEPSQVLRYERGGQPLLVASEPLPESVPACEYCGSERQFEFQIMPQMLSVLKENDLDWGVLLVYTCKASCIDVGGYRREFVFKQDVFCKD